MERLLLQHDATVSQNKNGYEPLRRAAVRNHADVVEMMVKEFNWDINIVSKLLIPEYGWVLIFIMGIKFQNTGFVKLFVRFDL